LAVATSWSRELEGEPIASDAPAVAHGLKWLITPRVVLARVVIAEGDSSAGLENGGREVGDVDQGALSATGVEEAPANPTDREYPVRCRA